MHLIDRFAPLLQTLWFTFSSVPEAVMEYYGIQNDEVNLLLNWGS